MTAGPAQPVTRGSIEAFSTMHLPDGLMSQVVSQARAAGKKVFTWCAWDVMQLCGPERKCAGCSLHDGCQGRGKTAGGFLQIEDLIAMRSRVSQSVWNHEVCCLPPTQADAVFAGFSAELHIKRDSLPVWTGARPVLGVDFGYAGAFAAVFVSVLGKGDAARAHVTGEFVQCARATLAANIDAVRDRIGAEWPSAVHVDPAGVAVNPHTGKSDVRVLRDQGFRVRFRRLPVETGLELIERLLCPALGLPRLSIDPSCTHLIAALQNYKWQAARTGTPEKDGVHDHIIDALRYALTGELLPGPRSELTAW